MEECSLDFFLITDRPFVLLVEPLYVCLTSVSTNKYISNQHSSNLLIKMSLLCKRRLHSRCVGRAVAIWSRTSARGPGVWSPNFFFEKHGAIWCNLGVPKYVITNVKITILRVINQQQQNLIAIFSSPINEDAHFCTEINTLRVLKGSLEGFPPEAE